MRKIGSKKNKSFSSSKDVKANELNDWRSEKLSHIRALIKQVDPDVVEEVGKIKLFYSLQQLSNLEMKILLGQFD